MGNTSPPTSTFTFQYNGDATGTVALSAPDFLKNTAFRVTSAKFDFASEKPVTWRLALMCGGSENDSGGAFPVTTCGSTRSQSIRVKNNNPWFETATPDKLAWVYSTGAGRYSGVVRGSYRLSDKLTAVGGMVTVSYPVGFPSENLEAASIVND